MTHFLSSLSGFFLFFPTSKYCRDPKLNIGLLSLQSTISLGDPMQSYNFKYDSHYKNSHLCTSRPQLAPEIQAHIQLLTWYLQWLSTTYLKSNRLYVFELLTFPSPKMLYFQPSLSQLITPSIRCNIHKGVTTCCPQIWRAWEGLEALVFKVCRCHWTRIRKVWPHSILASSCLIPAHTWYYDLPSSLG